MIEMARLGIGPPKDEDERTLVVVQFPSTKGIVFGVPRCRRQGCCQSEIEVSRPLGHGPD